MKWLHGSAIVAVAVTAVACKHGPDPEQVKASVVARFTKIRGALTATFPACTQPPPLRGPVVLSVGVLMELTGSPDPGGQADPTCVKVVKTPEIYSFLNAPSAERRADDGQRLLDAPLYVVVTMDEFVRPVVSGQAFTPGRAVGRALRFDATGTPVCQDPIEAHSSAEISTAVLPDEDQVAGAKRLQAVAVEDLCGKFKAAMPAIKYNEPLPSR
jgi:hypothetical protein